MLAESFYRKLNETAPEDRWEEWKLYRDKLMNLIVKAMWSNSSCIILGAGNLHDIDLKALPVKEPALADIDTEAVTKGLKFQNYKNKAEIIKMDIGGLDSSGIFSMIESTPGDLKKILESHDLDTLFETMNYDNVLLSAVYTQLFIPQFLTLMSQNDELGEDALETALSFTAWLITHLNDTVIKLAADDATVCAWSDIFEYESGDPALRDIINHIDDSKWMEAFYLAYIRDYGHGLGSYGIEDLSTRLRDVEEKWLVWPFDTDRTMIVKVISGTKER